MKRFGNTKEKPDIEKAIENFKDAEKLDPLNKDIYIQKGLAYMIMVKKVFDQLNTLLKYNYNII